MAAMKVGAHLLVDQTGTPTWSSEEQSEQPTESQLIWPLETKECKGHLKMGSKIL